MQTFDKRTFLKQLLSLPTVLDGHLSPDARWVAFRWYRIHENVDVFLVPTDGSIPPVELSHTPEYTELVSWTADSRAVILAEDHDGDEHVRLFRVDLNLDAQGRPHPSPMQPLTEDAPPYFIRGGSLSPDGSTLYYGANYDFHSSTVIEPTWIYRHDLRTNQRIPIARPSKPAYTHPMLNLAGTHLLFATKEHHPAGMQIHLVDVRGEQDREILNFGDRVKVFARWLSDSEHILFLSESTRPELAGVQQHMSLGLYHWPTGKHHWLIDDPRRSLENAWASPHGAIIVDELKEATHYASIIEPPVAGWKALGAQGLSEARFPTPRGNLLPLGRAADGAWVALYYASNVPTELVRLEAQPSMGEEQAISMKSLTRVWEHTSLSPEMLAAAESFHWHSEDGLRIQGWLYRARPNPRRAVIYVHGGPSAHSEDKINAEIQYFVAQGFNVLDVNYRGSTGFGLKFRELIKEDGWGGREQVDIARGAQALIQAGLAEPGTVGVTGTSYGGYSSWFLITHYPPEVIAAAAPICGMTDLVIDYETTRPDLRPYSEEMIGGSPTQVPQRYYERSPIHFVRNIRGKLLIVQGGKDPNVTPENMRQVVKRLQEAKIPYEQLVFEDEGHGIYRLKNQETLYMRLAEFFDAALRPSQ